MRQQSAARSSWPRAAVGLGQVGVVGGLAGVAGHRPADQLDGPPVVALLVGDDAEQVQGLAVSRLLAQDALVEPGRLRETALAMMLQGQT